MLIELFTASRGIPAFFLASLALFVFAVKLRWFPLFGATAVPHIVGNLGFDD